MIGSRGAPGREEFTRYAKGAVTIPGSAISRLESIASRTGVFLVVGVIEQDTASSTLFCTAVYVSPTRGYVGKHRKLVSVARTDNAEATRCRRALSGSSGARAMRRRSASFRLIFGRWTRHPRRPDSLQSSAGRTLCR